MWSGCQGNPSNRFDTEAECLHHCIGGVNRKKIFKKYFAVKILRNLTDFFKN
jgi:beta-xylosidase